MNGNDLLLKLWPPFAEKIIELSQRSGQKGVIIKPQCGLRTFAEQDELYARGRTKQNPYSPSTSKHPLGEICTTKKGGESWHNFGVACDMIPLNNKWSADGKSSWELCMGEIGEKLGLTWGGRWVVPIDAPHFQLTLKLSLQEAKHLHDKGGLGAIWNELTKRLTA